MPPPRTSGRAWSPDPRLSNVPSNVLRGRNDEPVSITSPALEWAIIQAGAIANPLGRALYRWELDLVHEIFESSLIASAIRVVETRILSAPTTLGNQIRVPPGFSFNSEEGKAILVHEAAHVWQFQTRGTNYITCSIYHNATGQIATGNRNVAYMNYVLNPQSDMSDFTAEEQATIVGDYYEITKRYAGNPSPPAWVRHPSPDLPIYERLIGQVRSALPRTATEVYEQSLMNRPMDSLPPSPGREGFAPVIPLLQIRFRGL